MPYSSSLNFLVEGMSSESRAVLFYFKSFRVRLLILSNGVISVTALSARKGDPNSLICSHIYLTKSSVS